MFQRKLEFKSSQQSTAVFLVQLDPPLLRFSSINACFIIPADCQLRQLFRFLDGQHFPRSDANYILSCQNAATRPADLVPRSLAPFPVHPPLSWTRRDNARVFGISVPCATGFCCFVRGVMLPSRISPSWLVSFPALLYR